MIKPEGRGFNSHPGQSIPLSLCRLISIWRANAHIVYGLRHQHFTSHSITLFIGRTDGFVAGASSDISEEMIKLSFLECFQIMMFLRYFFVTTSSLFSSLPLFFFLFKVQSKIGVRIIHGRALYTGKYAISTPELFSFAHD